MGVSVAEIGLRLQVGDGVRRLPADEMEDSVVVSEAHKAQVQMNCLLQGEGVR